jgi:hypothetical protein
VHNKSGQCIQGVHNKSGQMLFQIKYFFVVEKNIKGNEKKKKTFLIRSNCSYWDCVKFDANFISLNYYSGHSPDLHTGSINLVHDGHNLKKSVLKKIIVYFSLFVKNALYFFVCGLYPGRPGGKNLSGSLDEQFSPKITKKKLHFVIAEIE